MSETKSAAYSATSVNDIVPRPSASVQRKELRQVGFMRGQYSGNECSVCDKPCGKGWWQRVSYEYDEWEVYCRGCALGTWNT